MKNHTENSSSIQQKQSSGLSCKEQPLNRIYQETTNTKVLRLDNQQMISNNNGNYRSRKGSDLLDEDESEFSLNFDDSQQEYIPYESVKRFLTDDNYNDNNVTGKELILFFLNYKNIISYRVQNIDESLQQSKGIKKTYFNLI